MEETCFFMIISNRNLERACTEKRMPTRLLCLLFVLLFKNVAGSVLQETRRYFFFLYVYICIYDKRQRELEIEKTNEQREEYKSEERR